MAILITADGNSVKYDKIPDGSNPIGRIIFTVPLFMNHDPVSSAVQSLQYGTHLIIVTDSGRHSLRTAVQIATLITTSNIAIR